MWQFCSGISLKIFSLTEKCFLREFSTVGESCRSLPTAILRRCFPATGNISMFSFVLTSSWTRCQTHLRRTPLHPCLISPLLDRAAPAQLQPWWFKRWGAPENPLPGFKNALRQQWRPCSALLMMPQFTSSLLCSRLGGQSGPGL